MDIFIIVYRDLYSGIFCNKKEHTSREFHIFLNIIFHIKNLEKLATILKPGTLLYLRLIVSPRLNTRVSQKIAQFFLSAIRIKCLTEIYDNSIIARFFSHTSSTIVRICEVVD